MYTMQPVEARVRTGHVKQALSSKAWLTLGVSMMTNMDFDYFLL